MLFVTSSCLYSYIRIGKMKTLISLAILSAVIGVCALFCVVATYVAGGLAAAQSTRLIPFVGPMVGNRIEAWVLGSTEDHVAEVAPLYPEGTPVPPSTPLPFVTPNPDDPNCEVPDGWPLYSARADGSLSQGFHPGHPAIDIPSYVGTSVAATMCGTVKTASWRLNAHGEPGPYGFEVVITNGKWMTRYAHNSEVFVEVGQHVDRGQIVALSGSTGNSTGPHLHYEVWEDGVARDPLIFVRGVG